MLELSKVFQPKSLLICALKCLSKVVVNSCVSRCSIDNPSSSFAVRNYLISIPSNICDLWVKEIISHVIKVHNLKNTDFIYTILFNSTLCEVDIDYINPSSLESSVSTLVKLFPLCINLKSLKASHSPFFWNCSVIVSIEKSLVHLRNLQELTLNNLNLKENASFVSSIGTYCEKLKYLDISYSALPHNTIKDIERLSNLETLLIKTKTSEIPTLTKELAKLLLISLPKLKIFDDDWESVASIIPVAMEELIKIDSMNHALLEHLNIYRIEAAAHFSAQHKSIKRLHLNSKIFRQKDVIVNIDDWLKQFPSLQSINVRIENFDMLQKLLKNNTIFAVTLHSVHISHCSNLPINCEHLKELGHLCPNLKSLEIVNPKYIHLQTYLQPPRPLHLYQPESHCFPELLNLSYSGEWDETLASLLLSSSAKLQAIALHVRFQSLRLLLPRHLSIGLKRLTLDLDEIDSFPLLFDFILSKSAALHELKFKLWSSSVFKTLRMY